MSVMEKSEDINYLYIGSNTTGKIIRLLRSSLYSDKWGSMVREIVSNAYDANKEVGYEGPVEVSLPTTECGEFCIKDYGKGMSPEFMKYQYTNIGHSSKELDIHLLGAFGLGRLTPLLISDFYRVETNYRGKKYIYKLIAGAKEEMVKEYEGSSGGNVGTTIRIPCSPYNHSHLLKALRDWCQFMNPLPLVDGEPLSIINTRELVPGVYLDGFWRNPSSDKLIVLNDWVPYLVPTTCIPNLWKSFVGREYNYPYTEYGSVVRFPIGALSINASRESIEHTDRTISALDRRLREIIDVLTVSAPIAVRSATSLREAIDMASKFPPGVRSGLVWKGIRVNRLELKCGSLGGVEYKISGNRLIVAKVSTHSDVLKEKHVFLDDLGNKPKRDRVFKYIESIPTTNRLVTIPINQQEHRIIKHLGWPLLSSLPRVEKVKKTKKKDTKIGTQEVKAYLWKGGVWSNTEYVNLLKYTEVTKLGLREEGICLVVKRGKVTKGFYKPLPHVVVIDELISFIPGNKPLYLIPESTYPLLKGKWELLDEVILRLLGDRVGEFLEVCGSKNYIPHRLRNVGRFNLMSTVNPLVTLLVESILSLEKETGKPILNPGSVLAKYIEEGLRIGKFLEEDHKAIWITNLIKHGFSQYENMKESYLKQLLEEVEQTYPLLKPMTYETLPNPQALIDYVRGIDLLTKEEE